MKRSDLMALQQQLEVEEKYILDAIKKIKSQRISLEVERMQLQSMVKTEKQETQYSKEEIPEETAPAVGSSSSSNHEQLDTATSSYNTRDLDLSIANAFDEILTGNYYSRSNESEQDVSEDDEMV